MAKVTRTKQDPTAGRILSELTTYGEVPKKGSVAPDFTLLTNSFDDIELKSFKGKNIILNIAPSFDTPTCSKSAKEFFDRVKKAENTIVLCISVDTPPAQKNFCTNNQIAGDRIQFLSTIGHSEFGVAYGTEIVNVKQIEGKSPNLKGFQARAVVAIDPNGIVTYSKIVDELTQEPDYQAAFDSLSSSAEKKKQAEVSSDQKSRLELASQQLTAKLLFKDGDLGKGSEATGAGSLVPQAQLKRRRNSHDGIGVSSKDSATIKSEKGDKQDTVVIKSGSLAIV